MRRFDGLQVWERSHAVVEEILRMLAVLRKKVEGAK